MDLFARAGIHPPESKHTSSSELKVLRRFPTIRMSMQQQIGPGAKACVKRGDKVTVGQVIGEPIAPMSVPIHSSVSGTVEKISTEIQHAGRPMEVIEIKNDFKDTVCPDLKIPEVNDRESFCTAVRDSGLVGLGGAGFPTHFKLNPPPDKKIDMLLINGMECEPFITSDDFQMREYTEEIIEGVRQVLKWTQIPQAIIGVEGNTPRANAKIKKIIADLGLSGSIKLMAQKARYPLGAEKMLIYRLTGRIVPEGGLPHDVGCLVLNVGTCRSIQQFLSTGMPLVSKIVTLDGGAVRRPGNYEVPIGAPIDDFVDLTGGFQKNPAKVIMGGPMMGIAVSSLSDPILKNNNAILVFSAEEAAIPPESACMLCGRCTRSCPMGLVPTALDQAARKEQAERLGHFYVMDCIECGCCTYVCPAKRYLVQNIRVGKQIYRTAQTAKKEAANANA
ncbi:MAG: electron transport complex subunit RsxC [Eubacteriales bacterium]|nr:electron transport complex subunit RsxC [Eubacteriales bacterium]